MRSLRKIAVFLVLLGGTTTLARAECEAVADIAHFHDAYQAMLSDVTIDQKKGARLVLRFNRKHDAFEIADRLLKEEVSLDHWELVGAMHDGEKLARTLIQGIEQTGGDSLELDHGRHIDWLAEIIQESGCAEMWTDAAETSGGGGNSGSESEPIPTRSSGEGFISLRTVLGMLGVIMAGLLIHKIRKTIAFRKRQVERLPRHITSVPLEITFADDTGTDQRLAVTAIDLSQGGAKLGWEEPAATWKSPDSPFSLCRKNRDYRLGQCILCRSVIRKLSDSGRTFRTDCNHFTQYRAKYQQTHIKTAPLKLEAP